MIVPRFLIVESGKGPEVKLSGQGGAPSRLVSPEPKTAGQETIRADKLAGQEMTHADKLARRILGSRRVAHFLGIAGDEPRHGSRLILGTFLFNLIDPHREKFTANFSI